MIVTYLRLVFGFMFFCFSTVSNADAIKSFEREIALHKGKVVYLDFWASWCRPCKQSFPWLNDLQQKYKEQAFTVFSVNLDANPEFARQFLEQTPANFPIFYDAKGKLSKKFKLKGMPSSFLLNPQGKIVQAHVGFNPEKQQQYEKEISALMARLSTKSSKQNIQ